jgi:ArsR family transcriptional regulator
MADAMLDITATCKAAADPLRAAIVRALAKDTFGVQELARIFDMPQPGMSHHLKILTTAGLLTSRRQGNSIFYRRALVRGDAPQDLLLEALFRALDETGIPADTQQRIETVHEERSAQSRLYFEKNSARFQERQVALCEWDEYAGSFLDILKLIPDLPVKQVLEVGPGHGELLVQLAKMFARCVAIDNSEKMLDLARQRLALEKPGKNNVSLRPEPLESLSGEVFDVVVLNMVLHHMPSPANTFRKLGGLVKAHGFLIVADLNAHDQDWARESCGDVWLGFAPEEIETWASGAGFTEMNSQYLGLRNGFQIQIKLFQLR